MSQDQPTRTPPAEPGDWEYSNDKEAFRVSVIWSSSYSALAGKFFADSKWHTELIREFAPGYWRRSPPLEPFAPTLPVVELWEGTCDEGGEYLIIKIGSIGYCFDHHQTFLCEHSWQDVKREYHNLRRTHVCKWEPADE